MLKIRNLYISPAHNYFGHHGKPSGKTPIIEQMQIECLAGRGIAGDRFCDYKSNYKGQITFFSWEVFEEVCRALGVTNKEPSVTRRNVITIGADLNLLIGKQFELQGIQFEGTEECRPCYWMDEALKAGAEEWLKGRGGLRARILSSGVLKRDITEK